MTLSLNLQVRQSQSLAMTPQLLQSIRLLQFHHVELLAFLEREAEGNPLLEIVAPGQEEVSLDGDADTHTQRGEPTALSGRQDDGTAFADAGGAEPHPDAAEFPIEGLRTTASPAGSESTADGERLREGPLSLAAHAVGEIREILSAPAEQHLAERWLADLDAAGYLPGDVELPPDVLPLLGRLQGQAEPAGLFARDLADCLAIQLRRRDRLDPVMQVVLAHLPLLARRDFAALSRLTGESESGVLDILAEIRTLDPRPGSAFNAVPPIPVVPDVTVVEDDMRPGGWRVELNPDAFPRIRVSDRPDGTAGDSSERAFMAGCRQSAGWLQRSLEGRARTILKVAGEIVRRQDPFLRRGAGQLRPMTLMDVAEAVGMHESTVSRVTAGKFMATPRGSVEMKAFFSLAIASSDGGEAHSAESVKLRIRGLVAAEASSAVLSDDDIAERLKGEGIDLARRTVAKYREALNIPSSVQRRREMKARRMAG